MSFGRKNFSLQKTADNIIDVITSGTAVVVADRESFDERNAFMEAYRPGGQSSSFYQTYAFTRKRERLDPKDQSNVLADQRCLFFLFSGDDGLNDSDAVFKLIVKKERHTFVID